MINVKDNLVWAHLNNSCQKSQCPYCLIQKLRLDNKALRDTIRHAIPVVRCRLAEFEALDAYDEFTGEIEALRDLYELMKTKTGGPDVSEPTLRKPD